MGYTIRILVKLTRVSCLRHGIPTPVWDFRYTDRAVPATNHINLMFEDIEIF